MGVAIGAVAGVAVGILIAPNKGTKTRHKIAREATDIFEKIKESVGAKS